MTDDLLNRQGRQERHDGAEIAESLRLQKLPGGICILSALFLLLSPAFAQEQLTIGVGEQKIVTVPAGSDIGYTGPLHVLQLDPGRIKVIGDGTGWGSITVKSGSQVQQYSVQIVSVPPEEVIRKMKALLGNMNLTFTVAGSQVIVEGRIETTEELERFNQIMESFPEAVNMVVIAAKQVLIDIAVTLVEVEATNTTGFGLLNIAPPTGTGSMSGTAIPLGEIKAGKDITNDVSVSFALSSDLLSALNAQIECGRAKIIANPRVVTINRKPAEITSGGEIPYRVVGATGAQGVEYKPYGISLKVTPEARANDVLMELHLESSEPVGAVSGASENPLTSRSVDMNVAVQKDSTLAIAGLYDAVSSRDVGGGCLFPLFAASSSARKREIIVLVTPRVATEGIGSDYFKMVKPEDTKR